MSLVSDVEDLAVSGITALLDKKIPAGALLDAIHGVTTVVNTARSGGMTVETAAAEIRKITGDIASNDAVVDKEIDGGS